MNPSGHIKQIVLEYREQLCGILGDELDSVVLYGSQARGEAIDSSDIDLLIVLRGPFDYASLIKKTSNLTAAVSLEHDVVISRVFVTRHDYQTSGCATPSMAD
ncbi:MAG TPA: nucleotidyltransferase [Firmicutes bacterium]|nr:nucleotidyltransferase [Bacillota bacterium]